MSTTFERASELLRPELPVRSANATLTKILLAFGIAYGVLYVIVNDVIAAAMFGKYSRLDQAISELSGTAAPSRGFLQAMLPVFTLLVLGFGIGVWRSAKGNRALRVTGGILMAQGLLFPLWLFFPMTSRTEMVEGTTALNDIGHMVLTTAAVLFIVIEMAFSAAALGKWFRIFAIATLLIALVFGALTGVFVPDVEAGNPTPWMGFIERLSYGSWLVWMAVLAIAILRRQRGRPLPSQ